MAYPLYPGNNAFIFDSSVKNMESSLFDTDYMLFPQKQQMKKVVIPRSYSNFHYDKIIYLLQLFKNSVTL